MQMIKRIRHIKKFGIFSDYSWSKAEDINDFKCKNIIYGWNYSGKTMMSRLFSSLENKRLHEKYLDAEFDLVLHDGNKEIYQNKLEDFVYDVRVFNSDYVHDNLKWDSDENLEAISFDIGKINIDIRDEINKNENQLEKIEGTETLKGRKEPYSFTVNEFKEYESTKFSAEAKAIKLNTFNSLIEFNKSHFKSVKKEIEPNTNIFLIGDEESLSAIKNMSVASNDKTVIENISHTIKIQSIYESYSKIMNSEPPKAEIITVLENNIDLYDWAKKGYNLHRASKLDNCAFCGNLVSSDRYLDLNAYFSNASAELREKISQCKADITSEIAALKIINMPKSKNDFVTKCQSAYEKQLSSFDEAKKPYIEFLTNLIIDLARKEKESLFSALTPRHNDLGATEKIQVWLENTQSTIDQHNNTVNNFLKEQADARDRLKKHSVAIFLKNEHYYKKEYAYSHASECIRRYDCLVSKLRARNDHLLNQLKDIGAGRNLLNEYIKAFLNRDDINIEVTEENKFRLQRGSNYASNLSEGEKTAISFSYYLVTLASLHGEKKLKDTIIFIDDPISSLDANHIAQVYSLINSFFFRKGEDLDNPERTVNCFKQLFISTHNFEFFSFLKDSPQIKKKLHSDQYSGCEFYLMQRVGNTNSSLLPLPKSLRLKSEYVYLFQILYKFYKEGSRIENESIVLIPNALRRFLEIYTLIKLPGSTGQVDSRVRTLMGGTHELKTLHHFSHFTSFEKLTKHDEMLMNLPTAMQELISLLEKDESHYTSLKSAIGAS